MTTTREALETRSTDVTAGRTLMIAMAGALAFALGFYVGVFIVLSIVGFNDISAWQFELATIPAGTLAAAVAVALTSPGRPWTPVLVAAIVIAPLVTAGLILLGGDFAVAILGGGAVVVGVLTATGAIAAEQAA